MRIGEFANKHHLTIDTVRFYVMERLDFLEKLQPSNQFMNYEDSVYKLLISMKKRR